MQTHQFAHFCTPLPLHWVSMEMAPNEVSRGLLRAGIFDITAAMPLATSLDEAWPGVDSFAHRLIASLEHAVDPDTALDSYARLTQRAKSPELSPDSPGFPRLMSVLGVSEELAHLMLTRPDLVRAVVTEDGYASHAWNLTQRTAAIRQAVDSAPGFEEAVSALRREYYRQLSAIVARDVSGDPDPSVLQPEVSDALSDLAQASLQVALQITQTRVDGADLCRFAAIGMGKLGAHELNYVSDVDLIYVVEPARTDIPLQKLLRIGTKIGVGLQQVCSTVIPGVTEPILWQIDGALRPEGKDGQLVRRLASHEEYYRTWAKNWEFQALLKARFVAGDEALGRQYEQMAQGFVWQASTRENFVFDCQQMRRRVEDLIPVPLKDREIKLGRGGLRDVEFTVQMLQLVHGRTDESLRNSSTLGGLQALSDGGYVSRKQAAELGKDYRFERVLEHRVQLWRLHRTHLFPDLGEASAGGIDSSRALREEILDRIPALRRLARVFDLTPTQLLERFDATRREIRRLHLDIYYRPMLPQIAQLSEDDIALSGAAIEERFTSIGFEDPASAIRHVEHLSEGISRAAKINRVILPALLQWLGEGQNPDMGLLTLRRLEESFGQNSDYVGFLRDSRTAAARLCHVVANSRYLADALTKSLESVTWLGDDDALQSRSKASLDAQCALSARRFAADEPDFTTSLRALRRREIERIGLAWMNGATTSRESFSSMTDVYDAVLQAALQWAIAHQMSSGHHDAPPAAITLIAMGRYGGREVNFSSDADIVAMYEPAAGVAEREAAVFARSAIDEMRSTLMGPGSLEQGIDLDFDLRPEGKNGLLVRSLDSFREYYRTWASTWEFQALLRARVAAGDEALGERFLTEIADPVRYPLVDLEPKQIQEIRKLKARMEAERLPRGVARDRHLKLGKGGLSDVEWTVQFLQLRHSGHNEGLRTVSTMQALHVLADSSLISRADARTLETAWRLTTDARNANFLWQGRPDRADILPDDTYSLGGISACMNQGARRGQDFENEILSAMRRCRAVAERLFYES